MKYFLQIIVSLLLLSNLAFAQNATSKVDFEDSYVRPYVNFGVNFLNNDDLIKRYNTTSLFHLGFGLQIGKASNNLNAFAQYSLSSFTSFNTGNSYLASDSSLNLNQLAIGFFNSLYQYKENKLRFKFGYNQIWVDDSKNNNKSLSYGFITGLRFERKIDVLKIFTEFDYVFSKTSKGSFSDYDMKRITFGFGF